MQRSCYSTATRPKAGTRSLSGQYHCRDALHKFAYLIQQAFGVFAYAQYVLSRELREPAVVQVSSIPFSELWPRGTDAKICPRSSVNLPSSSFSQSPWAN